MTGFLSAPATVDLGSGFGVAATIENSSYVATGVQIEPTLIPLGVTLKDVATRRWDGVDMSFLGMTDALTLGNVYSGFPRSAFWSFTADTPGPKTFKIRAWSENAGEVTLTQTIQVKPPRADLVETALTTILPRVVRAPGTSFSVTDTVQNIGAARADASTTRYYLSRDPVKRPDDVLLGGSHTAHGLDPGRVTRPRSP